MDRPNQDRPNEPRPANPAQLGPDTDPPGGYAHMPVSMPDPADGSTAPAIGDVPPMRVPEAAGRIQARRRRAATGADLVGYRIEARDGPIGTIDEASTLVSPSCLVVDTGTWLSRGKILVPAGAVNRVDVLARTVYVDRTRQQVRSGYGFNPSRHTPEYRGPAVGYPPRPAQ